MSISVERENQIIATVSYIHRRMGFYHPPFSFQRFFQLFPDYQIVPARLPQGFDGELLLRQGKKVIRYRLGSRERTIRFTLAHEIAHSFLHRDSSHRCQISRRVRIYHPSSRTPREREADIFALELLVPMPMLDRVAPALEKEKIRKLAPELAGIFGINTQTMLARLSDLLIYREWEEGEWL